MAKPEIRLKGFDGEWIQSRLGRIFSERIERNIDGEMLSVTMNAGIIKASTNGRYDNSSSDRSNYKVVKVNDIAYNSMRMWQGASGCSQYEGIVSPAYTVVTPSDGIDSKFFAYLFKTKAMINEFRLNSQGLTSDTWNLKYPSFSKILVHYPQRIEEQQTIVDFFKSLDSMIQGVTKKISSLRQMKQACLVSMFPQTGETKPRVRFKGFEEDWEIVKLSSIATRVTRKNSHLESTLPLTISAAEGLIEQTAFFNNVVASSNVSGYYLVKRGEFAYNKSYSNGYPFGAVKRLDRYDMGVLSTLYIVFSVSETICSDYIVHFFDTSLWHQEVAKRAAEGARNHGLLNIGAEDFLDIDIIVPQSKEEQQKIASFFHSLDSQISLQEQRLEKLKQIKSACLDKMFV